MGLVDYSDSDSEAEAPAVVKTDAPASKKPSSNPIARSATGRILVSLPSAAAGDAANANTAEPPAKRARLGAGAGSSRFSNFSSFLPPPKVTKTTPAAQGAKGGSAPRPGFHLRTGAEPAFNREAVGEMEYGDEEVTARSHLGLPPPRVAAGPTIPEGQKPEEEVKLVGKPLMFKPLSVARKPTKKKRIIPGTVPKQSAAAEEVPATASSASDEPPKAAGPRKLALFSVEDETPSVAPAPASTGAYEPMFSMETSQEGEFGSANPYSSYAAPVDPFAQQAQPAGGGGAAPSSAGSQSLAAMADDLGLSKKARRELFGRDGPGGGAAAKIVNFNMEHEYAHNQAVRASGDQQAYNPVRAIAPGKHNLRQLVNAAQTNQTALEDSFAANKSSKREAGSRYGWG